MPSRLKSVSVDAVGDEILNAVNMTACLTQGSQPCGPFWSNIQPQDSYLSLNLTQQLICESRDLLVELSH